MEIIQDLPFDIIGVISKNLSLPQFRLLQKICGIPDKYFQGFIEISWDQDYQVTIDRYLELKKRYHLAKFKVDLSSTRVKDVSMLDGCHILILSFTPVRDVSMLGNCHTLSLYMTPVEDASALGNCHTLDLNLTKVTDISALGNVVNLYRYLKCISNP